MIGTIGVILLVVGIIRWKNGNSGGGLMILVSLALLGYDIIRTYPGKLPF